MPACARESRSSRTWPRCASDGRCAWRPSPHRPTSAGHPRPQTPQDLARHACVNLRLTSAGGIHAWESGKDGGDPKVRVDGQLTFNRVPSLIDAAKAGRGVAFVLEDHVASHLASGALERVLDGWCPPFAGCHLCHPSRRRHSPAFRLLIDGLRQATSKAFPERG